MTEPEQPVVAVPEDAETRAGMALASALMAANYPGDSGEDVDRLITELAKRGYRLVSDADDDEILRAVAEARRDAAEYVNERLPGEKDTRPQADGKAINVRAAVVPGHNHRDDETRSPTFPTYREACPMGCDDVKNRNYYSRPSDRFSEARND